jgi:uncharacterized membrane protein (UPF0182 family)
MYIILFIVLLASAVGIIIHGLSTKHIIRTSIGVALGVFTFFLFWFMGFWGELLWFDAIGYPERFWTVVLAKLWLSLAGGLLGAIVLVALTWTIPGEKRLFKIAAPLVGLFIGIQWGFANWDTILRYLNRVSTQVSEPILGKDVAFYFVYAAVV